MITGIKQLSRYIPSDANGERDDDPCVARVRNSAGRETSVDARFIPLDANAALGEVL